MKNTPKVLVVFGTIVLNDSNIFGKSATILKVDFTKLLPADKANEKAADIITDGKADGYIIPSLYNGLINWQELAE